MSFSNWMSTLLPVPPSMYTVVSFSIKNVPYRASKPCLQLVRRPTKAHITIQAARRKDLLARIITTYTIYVNGINCKVISYLLLRFLYSKQILKPHDWGIILMSLIGCIMKAVCLPLLPPFIEYLNDEAENIEQYTGSQ